MQFDNMEPCQTFMEFHMDTGGSIFILHCRIKAMLWNLIFCIVKSLASLTIHHNTIHRIYSELDHVKITKCQQTPHFIISWFCSYPLEIYSYVLWLTAYISTIKVSLYLKHQLPARHFTDLYKYKVPAPKHLQQTMQLKSTKFIM